MKTKLCFAALAAVLVSATVATADIAYLDFGRSDNQTTGLADTYNNIGSAVAGAVLDGDAYDIVNITGVDTGIDLTFNPNAAGPMTPGATSGSYAGAGANQVSGFPTALTGFAPTALEDGIFVRNTNGSPASPTAGGRFEFELTGLDQGSTYELLLYGARGNSGGASTHLFVSDDGGTTFVSQSFEALNNSSTVAVFSGLSAANDSISVILTTDNGANGGLNFGQLTATAVPEPGSAGLLMLGLMGCSVLRKRR